MTGRERGFTLVELLVSMSLTLCVTAAIFAVVKETQGVFTRESESADLQQRARVATAVLFRDLVTTGAGSDLGVDAGPLTDSFTAILPYHQARVNGDAAGTFRSDAITLLYVPSMKAQTTIASSMAARSGAVWINSTSGCSLNDAACGFTESMSALVYDATGSFDCFKVDSVQGSLLQLQHTIEDSPKVYPAGSRIVQAVVRSYYLKADAGTDTYQLMRDDGDGGPAVPVLDHVVRLFFEYFGDPQPPVMRKPLSDPVGPWTTYGPKPPAPPDQPTAYPPGENCVFLNDTTSTPAPRLARLNPGAATALAALEAAQLTDGPWCPDQSAPNRFDADLLRIRKITVTVRIESAVAALRGSSGALFFRRGTSTSGSRLLPDQEIRFHVSPRNLALVR